MSLADGLVDGLALLFLAAAAFAVLDVRARIRGGAR